MVNTEIQELFNLAQNGQTQHKKHLKVLHTIYQRQELEEFFPEYIRCVLLAFQQDLTHSYAKSLLTFASTFCVEIVTEYENRMSENDQEEYEPHPLFLRVVNKVLQYSDLNNVNVRYHACQFLAMILETFSADIGINDEICDIIQRVLLDRTMDPKPQIRTQAVRALQRLQNPRDTNCAVIQSFINALGDPMSTVRKQVIESIAPYANTHRHIINRLRDVDASVRAATYSKLSKCPPKSLSIVYRQSIIMSGLLEVNAAAKRAFKELLLSKWLKAYDSNVLQLMCALKLDANEEDVKQTELIYERILPIIFPMLSLQELVTLLELNDAKVISVADLSLEKITYWNFFIGYLQQLDSTETESDIVIPVLRDFTAYIDSFVDFKSKTNMEHWEYLEYQQIIRKLFEMLLKLDTSDEFGREAMQKLIISTLTNVKLEIAVIGIIIKAFHSIEPDVNNLAYELCTIIGDIKDPLEAVGLSEEITREREIQIAQLKVRLHILTDDMKIAVQSTDYDLVDKLSKEGEQLKKQVTEAEEKLNEQLPPVRRTRNDMDTICRCMDIIIAFIENVHVEKIPDSLITFRSIFFAQNEIDPRSADVYAKIFKMTCLYALLDKNLAVESLETIYTPIMAYRITPVFEKKVLQIAIGAISDLMRVHGPQIFNTVPTMPSENSKKDVTRKRGNDRTLYCEDDCDSDSESPSSTSIASTTPNTIIDIMLNMLDDNHPEIREDVAVAISKLVCRGICVNSSLIARLLLKWFNPSLNTDEKCDQKIQRYIGTALTKYFHDIKGSIEVLEKAVIPTLCFIGNAPRTSPLAEVDFDDVLQCLIKFTKIRENESVAIHKNLAYSILSKMSKSRESAVRILGKMLLYLDIPTDEANIIKELSQQVEAALDNVNDKTTLTYLKKYFNKLNGIVNEVNDTGNTLNGANATLNASATPAKGRKRPPGNNTLNNTEAQTSDSTNGTLNASATPAKGRKRLPSDNSLNNSEAQTIATPARGRRKTGESGGGDSTPAAVSGDTNATPAKGRRRKSSDEAIDTASTEKNDKANPRVVRIAAATPTKNKRGPTCNSSEESLTTIQEQSNEESVTSDTSTRSGTPVSERQLRSSSRGSSTDKGQGDANLTPRRSRRQSAKTAVELETIHEQQQEEVSNSFDSTLLSSASESSFQASDSNDSAFLKDDEPNKSKQVSKSVKRKKVRGKSNIEQKTNKANTRASNKHKGNVVFTQSSSDSEDSLKPRTRKSSKK